MIDGSGKRARDATGRREHGRAGALLHLVLGGVAIARDDLVLDVLVLLVLDFQRLVIGADQLHLQLAIAAVLLGVGGLIGDGVLVANRAANLTEDFRKLARKSGDVTLPARHLGEVMHLVIGLGVIHH